MMGNTHVWAGITAALLAVRPENPASCVIPVTMGALGGLLPDVDIRRSRHGKEILIAWLMVLFLAIAGVVLDLYLKTGYLSLLWQRLRGTPVLGAFLVAFMVLWGRRTPHRTLTHSFFFVGACAGAMYLILPPLALPFAAGGLSHLLLDALNRKPESLLYPFPGGCCMGLCRADGAVNTLLLVGCLGLDFFLVLRLVFPS